MGWRGAVRSMAAAARRAEREAERQRKVIQRQELAADAEDAVAEWRDHIRNVVSLHIDAIDDVDWHAIRAEPEPEKPNRSNDREMYAVAALESFKPRLFYLLKGGSAKRKMRLEEAVSEAELLDTEAYQRAMVVFEDELKEWRADRELAGRLIEGDLSAQRDVISEMQSLTDEGLIGTRVSFQISDEHLHAVAYAHTDEIIPKFRRKQLQSGRLSETKMPAGEANELYQDYICSVALRIAGDLFGIVPRDELYVTCVVNMLDRKTGHMVDTPVLSVRFVRPTFKAMALGRVDPSDSMRNFVHEMNFKRTSGFAPITPLKAVEG